MNQEYFDIIITGAGPAGATCALALKDSGLKVALIDKEVFPRDKICGDAVSSVTKRVLRQIDPDYEKMLIEFGKKSIINSAKLHAPNFKEFTFYFSNTGFSIKRMAFDNWLYNLAVSDNKNLSVYAGTVVKDVNLINNGVEVNLGSKTLCAKLLIACDGAHSVAAKKLAGFKVDRKHYSGAVRQYYKNIDGLNANTIEVYFLQDYLPGYFWIFPLENNQANIGFGMLSETIAQNKIDLKSCLKKIVNDTPEIAERFKNAEPLDEIKGFGLPLGSKKYNISGNNFMLCGDAASLISPLSGEGIETAMDSGRLAAIKAIECFKSDNFSSEFLKGYDESVYKKLGPLFKKHYLIQRIIGKRIWLINSVFNFLDFPFIKKRIARYLY